MKDAYYFPHDYNARNDPKIIVMINSIGIEAYAIYWILIEMLRAEPEYTLPLAVLPGVAAQYRITEQKVVSIVEKFGLFVSDFQCDVPCFFSPSLSKRMLKYDQKKQQARDAVNARWEKEKGLKHAKNTVVLPPKSVSNTSKVKESKVKESKRDIKRAFKIPQQQDLKDYFFVKNAPQTESEKFYDYYTANGWKVGRNPMKDWKAAARNWIKNIDNGKHTKEQGGNRFGRLRDIIT